MKLKLNQRHSFCIAPMMDWTDRHCRFFHRLLTRRALLYSEMITTGAVIHGDRARLLASDPAEQPVALQLGGCDPRVPRSGRGSALRRSTSMSAARRTACRRGASAPA
jgi:tRNA-dihydrouridine synthase